MKRDVNQLKTGFFSAISSVFILHMLHSQNNGKFHFEETFLPFIIMIIKMITIIIVTTIIKTITIINTCC